MTPEGFRYVYLCGIVSRLSNICWEVWWQMSRPVQTLQAPERSKRLKGPLRIPALSYRHYQETLQISARLDEPAAQTDVRGSKSMKGSGFPPTPPLFLPQIGEVESHGPNRQKLQIPTLDLLLLPCWITLASHWPSLGSGFLGFKRRR